MKNVLLSLLLVSVSHIGNACPICDQRQPKLLRGITHGAGPESNWDYLIISVMGVIVLVTLFYSVKWLLAPGEKSASHIKRFILDDPYHGR